MNAFWIRPDDAYGDFNRMRLLKKRLDQQKEEEAEIIDIVSGDNEVRVLAPHLQTPSPFHGDDNG